MPASRSRADTPVQSTKGLVDSRDGPVRQRRQVPARRVVVEVLDALLEQRVVARRGTHRGAVTALPGARNPWIAAIVSAGALRFGQWPVAFMLHEPLPGIWRWTYSPTACGAITSSAHCRISVGRSNGGEVRPVVGEERHAGEMRRDRRDPCGRSCWSAPPPSSGRSGVAHDHRRHRARPAEIVAVQRLEQPVDVGAREPADVVVVVDDSAATARPARASRTARAPWRRRARRSSRSPSGRRR